MPDPFVLGAGLLAAADPGGWAAAIGWGAITTAWGGILLAQRGLRRDRAELEPAPAGLEPASASGPSVPGHPDTAISIIVPTRNAASTIEASLESVLAQDARSLEVVLVDDRSTDDTPRVLRGLAARDPRVRTLRVDELPEGWLGKSHALHLGARAARGRWLLFVDDDCTLHAAAARTVTVEAERRGAELLTLWPRHDGETAGEHLVVPLCGGIIALWYGRRRGERLPFANGQFLLLSRAAYDRIGGHARVRDALIEDVAIAEEVARAGIPAFVGSGRQLVGVRMYDGLASAMRGWSRIFVGALRAWWRVVLSILWLLFGNLLPFVALPLLAAGLRDGASTVEVALVGQGVAHVVLMTVVSWGFWGLGNCPRRWLALYPLSILLVIAILVRTGWDLSIRRRVRWRSTDYRIDGRGRILGT